ncbi:drug/metabolite exporter YedA [bacterium CPR1]|nr:drug/metabolite exporter YedA [bacterium CPR1]
MRRGPLTWGIVLALLSLYFIWGSTYLAIRYTLESLPPLLTAGYRFLGAGLTLYVALRIAGHPHPEGRRWLGAALVGTLLLFGGNGLVMLAERHVHSGLVAVLLASVALWTALFSGLFGQWPSRREFIGIAIGLLGVVLLNLEGNLQAHPLGAFMVLGSALAWALGSVLSTRLPMPRGLMAAAAQMLCGGALLTLVGSLLGETWPAHPTALSLWAFAYMLVFGSLVGFTAYNYLLQRVSASLATSYAYVNPVVAVLLGVWLGGESISSYGIAALVIILSAVALVASARKAPPVGSRDEFPELAEVA